MAIQTNFKSSQNIKAVIGIETAVGSGTLHGSGTWNQLALISAPTINENQVALDMGSQQTGLYTPNHNQMTKRLDNPMWEIQLQCLAPNSTAQEELFLSLFKDTGSAPHRLYPDYTPPDLTHNATNTFSEYPTFAIYIGGGSYHASNDDYKFMGCVLKSIELSHSIDSNGGFPVMNMTFVTGYIGAISNDVSNGSGGTITWTNQTGNAPVHWTELSCQAGKFQGETPGSSAYDVRAYGYNLAVSRDIQRVGYHGADFQPYSYEMVGGFTVTGDITFKKDTNFAYILDFFRSGHMSGFQASGSGYGVYLNGLVTDVSNDTGSAELKSTVSFQGAGNPKITDTFPSTVQDVFHGASHTQIVSPNHGLAEGQRVTISGSSSLDGDYYLSTTVLGSDRFDIDNSWSGGSESGTWALHIDSKTIVSIDL